MNKLKEKTKQYGKYTLIRIVKYFLRKIGIVWDKHFIVEKEINSKKKPISPRIKTEVKELTYKDFLSASNFTFPQDKIELFQKRFTKKEYIAFGAFHEDKLVYYCWISLEEFEPVRLSAKVKIDKNEGLLLDFYTHPDYRGLGISTFMIGVQLNKLRDYKKKKAIALVLYENKPSRKAFARNGFECSSMIYYKKIFGEKFIKLKKRSIKL